jgi:lipopolysaccharide export system protein LptC
LNRQLLAVILLLASLLSIGWWIRQLMTPEETLRKETAESPEYYAEQLTVHTYDKSGRLEQTLKTPHMKHFTSSATTELSQPRLWRFNPDTPPWRMQAERALADSVNDSVFMPGEVLIDRDAGKNSAAYHITTRDLTLETANAHATTAAPIRMQSGSQWITAIGMEGWLKAPIRLHLRHQVRGRYVFD